MRSGATLSLHKSFPNRPADSMITGCLVCTEIGVNIDATELKQTSSDLMHTVKHRATLDGNFQLNQYRKNHSNGKVSLWGENGYTIAEAVLKREIALATESNEVQLFLPD